MTRILFYEPSYRRIAPRLAGLKGIEPILMDGEGRCTLDGRALAENEIDPEIGWAASDLFTGPVRAYMIALLKARNLKWVQSGAAGFDNPVFAQIIDKGAKLTTNHSQAVGMSEYVLATVLDHFQRGGERRAEQAKRRWTRVPFREIAGSRWLIVGFGAIGKEVAKRARAFGAHVTGIRRTPGPDPLADVVAPPERMADHLKESDVVVLVVPLSPKTENLADAKFLAAMKPRSVLVNIGRGGLVDESALLAALDKGTPEHAILDVFKTEPLNEDSPFWTHPRVTLTPHASAIGSGLVGRTDDLFVANLGRYLKGKTLLNEADPADVSAG